MSVDGLTAETQLDKIREYVLRYISKQEDVFDQLTIELRKEGIHLLEWQDLTDEEKQNCNQYFINNIFPILTPLSVDPGKPFPLECE